jgi:PAS domain-containing protein
MSVEVQLETDEIHRLRACVNDLISVLALPAIWSGGDPRKIGATLLDFLTCMLRPDFVYLQLRNSLDSGSPIEMLRGTQGKVMLPPEQVGRALTPWLAAEPHPCPFLSPNPIREGTLSIASRRLGLFDDFGVIVVGSVRTDFPSLTDKLLIDVAANQAVIGLQDAQRLMEQRRHAEELGRCVEERTSQLAGVNEELAKALEEIKRFQDKLRLVIDTIPAMVWSAMPDGSIDFVNQRWLDYFGRPSEKTLGHAWIDAIHPEDRANTIEKWRAVFASGEPWRI